MQQLYCAMILNIVALCQQVDTAQNGLEVEPDKENIVGSLLAGSWIADDELNVRLGRNARPDNFQFLIDHKIVDSIPAKYQSLLKNKRIYSAGTMLRGTQGHPFVLIENNGNPHLVYFRDRGTETWGDAESFNLFVVSAAERSNDILFVGGDFNNEPFFAYRRKYEEAK